MIWNPIFLGIIESSFINNFWIIIPITIVGTLLCFYRYKFARIVLPVIFIVCGIFLAGFLELHNYLNNIANSKSFVLSRIIFAMFISVLLPAVGAFLGWQRHQKVILK